MVPSRWWGRARRVRPGHTRPRSRRETGLVVTVGNKIWEANEYTRATTEKFFVKQGRFYEAHLTGVTGDDSEDDRQLLWVSPARAEMKMYHESQRDLIGQRAAEQLRGR